MRTTPIACLVLLTAAAVVKAHDTDPYTMPEPGTQFVDLGAMLNERVQEALEKGVDSLNDRIRRVLERDLKSLDPGSRPAPGTIYDPDGVLDYAHSPDGVARAVYDAFGSAVTLIEGLERELHSRRMRGEYGDRLTAYKAKSEFNSIYNKAYSPIDPRNISAIFHASTIKVFGVYLGTDKIGHFTDMGWHYFRAYRFGLRDGLSEQQAMAKAVRLGTSGLFSEKALLGYLTAGSYSNADLVANYTGCLFYRNLTEPVVIKGRLYESILERDGPYWRIRPRPDDAEPIFQRFVSDHWNEALNPSLYEPLMRGTVRRLVRERNANLLQWYADYHGDRDPAEYYENLARILSTYYGDDYGHSGKFDELIHLGNTIAKDP